MFVSLFFARRARPSMKVPPKRKGNLQQPGNRARPHPLNESPSEKEGKFMADADYADMMYPSMKVPPKRKGNGRSGSVGTNYWHPLNESPSEKEGKSNERKPMAALHHPQ